jgi:hypothetical protein
VLGKKVLGKWQDITKRLAASLLAALLVAGLVSCSQPTAQNSVRRPGSSSGKISEVATPIAIQSLQRSLEAYQPQVKILSPRADEVLQDTQVSVKLQVQDLPIFQDEALKLGSHLHLLLDNQPYGAIYQTQQPIVFDDLEPGTHTLRVFAASPWDESFKNEGAYAQTTFHLFAKTPENKPDLSKPLLTYSRPQASYGAEPFLLDFYISNVPLHLAAQEDATDDIPDWQIRCTINGESFTFDRWEPIYLKGLKPGKNWIQVELLDDQGNPFPNAFNNTVRLIEYQPGGQDSLSQLIRGEIPAAIAPSIIDPNYEPPKPEPEPIEKIEEPTPTLEPILVKPLAPLPIESPQPVQKREEKSPEAKPDIKAIEEAIEEAPIEKIQPTLIPIQPIQPAPEKPTKVEKPAAIESPISPQIPTPPKAPLNQSPVIEQPVIIKQPVIEQPIIKQPIVEEVPVDPALTQPEPAQEQPIAPLKIIKPSASPKPITLTKPPSPEVPPSRSSAEVRQRAADKMEDATEKIENTFDALRERPLAGSSKRSGKVSQDTQKFIKRFRKSPEAVEQQRAKGLLNRFQQPVGKMNDNRPIIDLDDNVPDFIAPTLEPIGSP